MRYYVVDFRLFLIVGCSVLISFGVWLFIVGFDVFVVYCLRLIYGSYLVCSVACFVDCLARLIVLFALLVMGLVD